MVLFGGMVLFYQILSNPFRFHSEFFSPKFDLVFAMSVVFHEQVLFFVYIFWWNNEYILDIVSRI